MSPFLSAEELKVAFDIQKGNNYDDFIAFKDGKVGFSIKRQYPPDISFKPPVKKDGANDTLAMIRVLYNPEKLLEAKLDLAKVPIFIDINKHSKYQYNHFGFNFDDDDCPTEESLAASQTSPFPIDLKFPNNFFFNHSEKKFVDKNGRDYSGHDVLKYVFDQHCDITHESQCQKWRSVVRVDLLCKNLTVFLEYLLRVLFRKRFDRARGPLISYRVDDIVLLEAESLEIFGYKATKNVIVTYAVLVLVAYTISYWTCLRQNAFFISIWKNPFLVLCATLVTLPLLEYLGPNLIRITVNVLNRLHSLSIKYLPMYVEEKSKK